MTIFDNRPDPEYIRSLWRGENPPKGIPGGCGNASCWCGGSEGQRREASRRRRRNQYRPPASAEDGEERPPKDPRYTRLPPT